MLVYMLVDPGSREVRYVGQTIRTTRQRLTQHLGSAREKTTPPVNAWIRGLLRADATPECVVLEEYVSREDMDLGEEFWIAQLRACGASLLNISGGGSTRIGYRHSEETKAKWRAERRGENAPMYGKHLTDEHKEILRQASRARIAKHGHPQAGVARTEETRRRISEGRRGVIPYLSPEVAERRRENQAKAWTDERRARQSMLSGLSNPNATLVVVDGVEYSVMGLANACGQTRTTVSRRVKLYSDRPLTMSDFTWTRKSREAESRNRRQAEMQICLKRD